MTHLRRIIAASIAGACTALVPVSPATADQVRNSQWHLSTLNVASAHKFSRGANILIGVIDTGVDAKHPDLLGSVLPGTDLTGESSDGRVDLDGHGTAMAGLIIAHGRALGIAPEAKILPVRTKVYGLSPSSSAEAIKWAVDNEASVLCLAFGEPASVQANEAIAYAIAHDVVVIASIGNEPRASGYRFPGAYNGVVAVAGVDRGLRHASISVAGPQAAISAPAVDIVSTGLRSVGNTGYRSGTGTSDATAIVAGAAALVRSKFPELSAAEVIHRLTATADDKGAPGRDSEYGFGVVNLVKALTADVPPLSPSPSAPPPNATAAPTRENHDSGGASSTAVIIGALTLLALLVAGFVAASLGRRASP